MKKTKLEKRVNDAEHNIEVIGYDTKWIFVLVLAVLAIVLFLAVMTSDRFSKIEAQLVLNNNVSWKCVEWEGNSMERWELIYKELTTWAGANHSFVETYSQDKLRMCLIFTGDYKWFGEFKQWCNIKNCTNEQLTRRPR